MQNDRCIGLAALAGLIVAGLTPEASAQVATRVRRLPAFAPSGAPTQPPLFDEASAPPVPFDPDLYGRGIAAGDLDGDGFPELVIANRNGVVILSNQRGAGFVDVTSTSVPAGLPSANVPLLADVDGDGRLDLTLLVEDVAFNDLVLFGDGAGGFGVPIALPPTVMAAASDGAWFDADGDGDLDLVRSVGASGHSTATGPAMLVLNQGAGVFTEDFAFSSAAWNDGTVATTDVLVYDANLDGVPDLYFTRADSGAVSGTVGARNVLLLGAGGGLFLDASAGLPGLVDNSFGVEALDIDGDGDLDLVVANSLLSVPGAASGDVLINQGGLQGGRLGFYRDAPGLIEETPSIAEALRLGVLVADVDLDGHSDVLVRVHDLPPGGSQPLFLGGTAPFERSSFDTGTLITAGGLFVDIDLDGDPDLVLTSAGSAAGGQSLGRLRLFVNRTR